METLLTHPNSQGSSVELQALPWGDHMPKLPDRSLTKRVTGIVWHRPDILISLILGLIVLFASLLTVWSNQRKHRQIQHEITKIEQRLDNANH